ncbi:MAG: serine/threonine protein kinase [Candidatus Obscuribacterales bacterium]|nr:serine/threonine protein kinase [Candidatus Obscuribacterales bacterium]
MNFEEKQQEIFKLKTTCPDCGKTKNSSNSAEIEDNSEFCACEIEKDSQTLVHSRESTLNFDSREFTSQIDSGETKLLQNPHAPSGIAGESALAPGQLVAGRYKIIKVIGRGGMGSVYQAHDLYIKRNVALKMLHREFASKPIIIQRFQKEVEAIAKLSHPGIVKVHDLGVSQDGSQFMVMDMVEGRSLDALLKERHHLPVKEALDIVTQVVESVEHAHANGVIHRDLKPSNIIISMDNQGMPKVRLVDFGIAKLIEPDGDSSKLTQTGDLFGSPQYMSPEQCRGEKLDQRADIYAIGCIFFEMITGQIAFSDENAVKTILKHLNDPRPTVKKELNVPGSVMTVIDRCLEKRKQDRYENCDKLLCDLKKIEAGKLVKGHIASSKKRALIKPIILGIFAVLLATQIFNGLKTSTTPETGNSAISISNSWQALDNEGQKALNKGDLAQAEKWLKEAEAASSASASERSRSLRKLALISHMKKESKKEIQFDERANRMEEASSSSNISARLALKQALMLLPNTLDDKQSKNLTLLAKQINSLVDSDIRAGHAHRDLQILNLSIEKLENNAIKQQQTMSSLLASRCRAYISERDYSQALKDAQRINKDFRTGTAESKFENQLLLSICLASTGQNQEAIDSVEKLLSQLDTANISLPAKESQKARASFLLGSLLLNTPEHDQGKKLIESCITNAHTAEAVAPLLDWRLNGEMHAPEILESLLQKVLSDGTAASDPSVRADYLSALGDVYNRQTQASNKQKEALAYYDESLSLRQRILPCDSLKVRTSISRLAATLNFLGLNGKRAPNEAESIPLINQWIASIQRSKTAPIEERNAELIKAYNYLTKASAANGDLNGAKAAMQKMVETFLQAPANECPFDEFFYSNARQMLSQDQWQSIEPALKARVKASESSASLVEAWRARDDLGHYYYSTGNMTQAGEQIRTAAESIEKTNAKLLSPSDKWYAADTLDNYAMYLRRIGNSQWQSYQKKAAKMRYGERAEQ